MFNIEIEIIDGYLDLTVSNRNWIRDNIGRTFKCIAVGDVYVTSCGNIVPSDCCYIIGKV